MFKRLWWVAAIALLIGLVLWIRRSPVAPELPSRPPDPPSVTTPSTAPVPGAQNPSPSSPVPPSTPQAMTGKLRVSIESPAGPFSGVLAVLSADGRKLAQQNAVGEGAESFDFDALPPGPCRVVFVPTKKGTPCTAEAKVPAEGVGSASLRIPASLRLRGKAFDALQRPLGGVDVTVSIPGFVGASVAPQSGSILFGTWNQVMSTPGGSGPMVSGGYALDSAGTLRLSATSAKDGSFSIAGLPANAVQVDVRYQKLRFTQACSTDVEAVILVPATPVEPAPDPAREEFKRAADVLLRQMVEHPEAGDVYWNQLKTLLQDWMSRPGVSPVDRKAVEDGIKETDRLRAESKK